MPSVSGLLAKAARLGRQSDMAARKALRAPSRAAQAMSHAKAALQRAAPSKGLTIDFKQFGPWRGIGRLFSQSHQRVRWLRREIARESAKTIIKLIKKHVPKDEWLKEYRNGFVVADVQGEEKNTERATIPTTMILHKEPSEQFRQEMVRGVSVEFVWAITGKPEPFEVMALRQYGPWTIDTLPYMPTGKGWTASVRRSSAARVAEIRKRNESEAAGFEQYFQENNEQMPLKGRGVEKFRKRHSLKFDQFVLGLEFGIHGLIRAPHLRLALRDFARSEFANMIRRNPRILKSVTDFQFSGWRSIRNIRKIPRGDIRKMIRFQQKLTKGLGAAAPTPKEQK